MATGTAAGFAAVAADGYRTVAASEIPAVVVAVAHIAHHKGSPSRRRPRPSSNMLDVAVDADDAVDRPSSS